MAAAALRRATAEDAAIIARHRRCMFADMGASDAAMLAWVEEAARPWLRERLADGRYIGVLIEADGAVIAGGGMEVLQGAPNPRTRDNRRGYIYNVYTEPAHRRQGHARRIMGALLATLREMGITRADLHASDEGRALYEALGFETTNEMRLLMGD
jgi:ribosomal protein S18 acetylase RimI-like enzyme